MTTIEYLIRKIKLTIPKEVLLKTFLKDKHNLFGSFNPMPFEEEIKAKVIVEEYLPDLTIEYGKRIRIPVSSGVVTHKDSDSIAIHFPPEARDGREIVTVYSLLNKMPSSPGTGYSTARNKLAKQNAPMMPTEEVEVSIVAPNTILAIDRNLMDSTWQADVMIAHDEELNSINQRYWDVLAEGAILLTKYYIYNNLIIKTNKSALFSGQELSSFSDVIASYESAYEEYLEFKRTVLGKSLFMQDTQQYNRYIQMQIR